MLEVALNLVAIAAMLFGIIEPAIHIEVDSLNSPTARPIPSGTMHMWLAVTDFKR